MPPIRSSRWTFGGCSPVPFPYTDAGVSQRESEIMSAHDLVIGLDVGSTTVKAVVVDPDTLEILWSDYQRHHTEQPEKILELLEAILAAFPDQPADRWRIFLTGSGSSPLGRSDRRQVRPRGQRRDPRGRGACTRT